MVRLYHTPDSPTFMSTKTDVSSRTTQGAAKALIASYGRTSFVDQHDDCKYRSQQTWRLIVVN